MAKLTAAKRKRLKKSSFAGPGRSYPIPDIAHGRQALRMAGHKSPATAAKIRAKVYKKYPSLKKKKSSGKRKRR